ncbi:MAG: hypothetical protein JXR83_03705 [Deltaproteobacteria bacterium]|nr:hypothetical protein [Deltaproteobacteria bacterium]
MRRALAAVALCAACAPPTVQITSADRWLPAEDGGADAAGPDGGPGDRIAADAGPEDRALDAAGGDGERWPDGPQLQRLINYQPSGNPPSGAEADYGEVFGLRGYGWGRDLTANTERADLLPSEPLLDTYILAGELGLVDQWQIRVPEARYLVTLAAGRPESASGPVRIAAEGVTLIDGDAPLRNEFLWVVDREVGVRDGMLTLDLGTGDGPSVVNFIEIESAYPAGSCTARAEVCNGVDDDCDQMTDEDLVCEQATVCYTSSLATAAEVSNAGFSLRGCSFVEGGMRIDAPGARAERTLAGNFYRGTISFEAKGLSWQRPLEESATACARTVFDLNHGAARDAARSRLFMQNRAPECGGGAGGTLRLTMPSAFCCLDSPPLPTADDGQWHGYRVTWDSGEAALDVDGVEQARTAYRGPSVGRDPILWFGSAGGSGDASNAVFRNLQVCNEVR